MMFLILSDLLPLLSSKQLDHHCPWTGKCIGKNNLKAFHSFLAGLCVHLIFVVCVTAAFFFNGGFDFSKDLGAGGNRTRL